jgi:hypothetical protein
VFIPISEPVRIASRKGNYLKKHASGDSSADDYGVDGSVMYPKSASYLGVVGTVE